MVAPESDPAAAPRPEHLEATTFIDSDHQVVRAFAADATRGAADEQDQVRRLFAAVRDEIRYDPYSASSEPEEYVASNVIARASAYCVPKAVVLTATARSIGIPARLGFSDVRNHLQSDRLRELMGTDVFVYHGYSSSSSAGPGARPRRPSTPRFAPVLAFRRSSSTGRRTPCFTHSAVTAAGTWSTSETAASSPICPWSSCTQR